MANELYSQIRTAFRHLNPHELREMAERPLNIGIVAASGENYERIVDELLGPPTSRARRREVEGVLHRAAGREPNGYDLLLCDEELLCPPKAFRFRLSEPRVTVEEILDRRSDLALPLARSFAPFRRPVAARIVKTIAKENAAFAAVSALPNVVPGFIQLPWAIGEFASDTAFLTMNQVRMAFLIAAASDRDIGYREQRAQIASIVGGAFGWRAIARELVGKIPLGGGIIPKAAIAYAGTYTVGVALERFYRIGYGMTRAERRETYEKAFERGKQIVADIIEASRGEPQPEQRRL
ncbi:MAG: hypothetical protein ACM3ZB_12580 [bacterium]|jgi:hypothetical protein